MRGRARGRSRGNRGRRGIGRGRAKKAVKVIESDEDENTPPQSEGTSLHEDAEEKFVPKIDMEADISQLEAPTFTTINRGPPEPMLRLRWDHKVSLIGEKVLNPLIHCCDKCLKPILIYGRMIPCKHVFCLSCARDEDKACPRCTEAVTRVEQTGLGTVFMCTHGGTRYGNSGCRRTYLSQRDLQAHINHRHNVSEETEKVVPAVQPHPVQPPRKPSQTTSNNDPRGEQTPLQYRNQRSNLITVPIQQEQPTQALSSNHYHQNTAPSNSNIYPSAIGPVTAPTTPYNPQYATNNQNYYPTGAPQYPQPAYTDQPPYWPTHPPPTHPPVQQIHGFYRQN